MVALYLIQRVLTKIQVISWKQKRRPIGRLFCYLIAHKRMHFLDCFGHILALKVMIIFKTSNANGGPNVDNF